MTELQARRVAAHRRVWDEAGVEYGRCLCGCGERTDVSGRTVMLRGLVRGEPSRWAGDHGRHAPRPSARTRVDQNPGGVCVCGCGTAVEPYASALPTVFHPMYAVGHQARKSLVDFVPEDRGFESLCWVWQRKITRKGYGIARLPGGRERHAHVVQFEAVFGAVPDGRELHHRCLVRDCVNPGHLVPLTRLEHMGEHARLRRVGLCHAA